ncbi:hypothetical protein GGX14DRAFT_407941 [Mycena pura]|uniref:Uncharacterized protein n=1 Tax=Mycena pura TaxID=153505 RepID=A0AAD6Y1S6_9AGAR|nr:hypothetical protein GGX14DRAFT_407941 [Mycena pura]
MSADVQGSIGRPHITPELWGRQVAEGIVERQQECGSILRPSVRIAVSSARMVLREATAAAIRTTTGGEIGGHEVEGGGDTEAHKAACRLLAYDATLAGIRITGWKATQVPRKDMAISCLSSARRRSVEKTAYRTPSRPKLPSRAHQSVRPWGNVYVATKTMKTATRQAERNRSTQRYERRKLSHKSQLTSTMTAPPSTVLRCRLQPQRLEIDNLPSRTTGFTPISAGQVMKAQRLSIPTHWSIEPDLDKKLIKALEDDLDALLPQHPVLTTALADATRRLADSWNADLGDDSDFDYGQLETATGIASRFLLIFGTRAFEAIRATASLSALNEPSFIIDNGVCLNSPGNNVMGMEDKRASLLPWAVMELSTRGLSCRIVKVEARAPKRQDNWWIVVNKGALYTAAYGMEWIVVGGMTVYCVAYRTRNHMLWCPVYNRRDPGDELVPETANSLDSIFGDVPASQDPQTGLPLLVLAVLLKGIMGKRQCQWLEVMFPALFELSFAAPSGEPSLREFNEYGRDAGDSSDEASSGGSSDGDDSSDFVGGGPAPHDNTSSRITRSSASTATVVSGSLRFTGNWRGELGRSTGHSVEITERLSEGFHGMVYAGVLLRNGRVVSTVAVKASDDKQSLLAEFLRYNDLKDLMGAYIPRCYGICIASGTAFLVTALVHDRNSRPTLTKAERGAAYMVLKKMHDGGWTHNDVVDSSGAQAGGRNRRETTRFLNFTNMALINKHRRRGVDSRRMAQFKAVERATGQAETVAVSAGGGTIRNNGKLFGQPVQGQSGNISSIATRNEGVREERRTMGFGGHVTLMRRFKRVRCAAQTCSNVFIQTVGVYKGRCSRQLHQTLGPWAASRIVWNGQMDFGFIWFGGIIGLGCVGFTWMELLGWLGALVAESIMEDVDGVKELALIG